MMFTYMGQIEQGIDTHTWMVFPGEWTRHGDWPDLLAAGVPSPVLVMYNKADRLFPLPAMRAAHERLSFLYSAAGDLGAYRGEFYEGDHKFDREMQRSAFAWFDAKLKNAAPGEKE